MGTGASRLILAKTHGPSGRMGATYDSRTGDHHGDSAHSVRCASSMRTPAAPFSAEHDRGSGSGFEGSSTDDSRRAAHSGDNESPLGFDGDAGNPLGEDNLNKDGSVDSTSCFTRLDAILGEPGSTAKFICKRSIGKGAYGEAFIVERNASYDPLSCPLAERQLASNQLARPTRVGGTYVVKVMDLRNMRQQDRQYAQTEITCIAQTHHFAIIRYYEHYILDCGDETMIIVTEFANHGDLARNLSRGRDTRFTDETTAHSSGPTLASSGSPASECASEERSASLATGLHATTPRHPQTSLVQSPTTATTLTMEALHLTEREAGMYFVQILAALQHIHKRRMIHRDVKSANLFLTSNGFIKIGDFGFSQKYDSTVSSETIAGTFLGTPYYVSPEMWKGTRYGKKADVWAAGIVLYEMLMDGHRPFDAMGLTDLKRVVLESDVVLPEYAPGADPALTGVAVPSQTSTDAKDSTRRGKFSPEMRELVQSIFQKDPKQRPSTEELLRTPIVQHFLFLFQRHVQGLIEKDARLRQENPSVNPSQLAFPDDGDRELVLKGLDDLNAIITQEIRREIGEPGVLHYEGVVYKGNRDGTWKERYLALDDDVLIISLSHSKAAAEGAERSRKVPVRMIKAVNKVQLSDPHLQSVGEPQGSNPTGYVPPFTFLLFMAESSSPIYFGVASESEVDKWMEVMMKALDMD